MDKDGLIYPSNLLFKILQVSYIFCNVCVSGDLEESFVKLSNQKHTSITIIVYTRVLLVMIILLVFIMYVNNVRVRTLGCFCNICLNDSRKNTDKMGNSKTKKKIDLNVCAYCIIFHFKVTVIFLFFHMLSLIDIKMYLL